MLDGPSAAKSAFALPPFLRFFAPSTRTALMQWGGRQGRPSLSQRPPCHSNSAMRAWSASVFMLLEVMEAIALVVGSRGSASLDECISIGPTPTSLKEMRSVLIPLLLL